MAPETRSKGTAAPPRVYHSSPALQQAQFPPRRKVVRTYGKHRALTATPSSSSSARVPSSSARFSSSARDPRQKTLTQIDFVSSSMMSEAANAVMLSDSDEDDFATTADKENERPGFEEDEQPVQAGRKKRRAKTAKGKDDRGKRRRTLGDENELQQPTTEQTKRKDEPRRRTLGDIPSSRYHTQTLTQFLGHEDEALIKDSEDEEDGFDDWLQAPDSPSPRSKRLPLGEEQNQNASTSTKGLDAASEEVSRQSSIVPQTPTKRPIRYEIPSSSQQSTPASRMLDRYGAPDEEKPSPSIKSGKTQKVEVVGELTGKPKRKLVIEDSFATESWGSSNKTPTKGTPLKDITEEATGVGLAREESSSATELMSTPTGPRRRKSLELGQSTPTKASPANISARTPKAQAFTKTRAGLIEIPDSDEEDEGFSENEDPLLNDGGGDESSDKENKTQAKPAKRVRIQSDIDKEKRESYIAGPETQYAMDVLESTDINLSGQPSASQQPPSNQTSTDQAHSSPELPPPKPNTSSTKSKSKPIRKPRRHLPPPSQTQPLESQRVAFATIKNFGQHSDRTDVLVVIPPSTIDPLVSGHEVDLRLPYKIPEYVERFWLFDGEYIRYGACVEPGQQQSAQSWRYHVWQVYELNDPKDEQYIITGENWFQTMPSRYNYVPPTGVSELMSNLRFALFGEQETQDEEPTALPPLSSARTTATGSSFSDSQQVEAQLQSDIAQHTQLQTSDAAVGEDAILVPSTPLKNKKHSKHQDTTPKGTNNNTQSHIRPSQATTVSQVSTPEKQPQPPAAHSSIEPPPPPTTAGRMLPSSSSIPTFQDTEGSSPNLMSNTDMSLRSSQLLTKSQMLPDSLLRDDARVPPEIWDSD